jgi:hypothetical protein
VWTEQFGIRNTEAGFDAICLGLVADGDTAAVCASTRMGTMAMGWPRSSGQSSCSIEAK